MKVASREKSPHWFPFIKRVATEINRRLNFPELQDVNQEADKFKIIEKSSNLKFIPENKEEHEDDKAEELEHKNENGSINKDELLKEKENLKKELQELKHKLIELNNK